MSNLVLSAVLASPLLMPGTVQEGESPEPFTSFLGEQPPELVVSDNGWTNWEGEVSLRKLRGHVVWLEFSFLH